VCHVRGFLTFDLAYGGCKVCARDDFKRRASLTNPILYKNAACPPPKMLLIQNDIACYSPVFRRFPLALLLTPSLMIMIRIYSFTFVCCK
jgi:hypothetical protein